MISFWMDYNVFCQENKSKGSTEALISNQQSSSSSSSSSVDLKYQQHLKTCSKCAASGEDKCDRIRSELSCSDPSDYLSVLAYMSYIFYPPLYLAGPILTFNNYISQVCTLLKKV